ncbi:MAG: NADH-quinone oxidoreductase subunit C, partial [Terriglobales bacterium]
MPLAPPITDIEQLKSHPALGQLMESIPAAVTAAKFDREELTVWIDKGSIREACAILRDYDSCP